jgi:pSer/pThr/pTyr-binding forkhead associated (FHA) protein
VSELALTLIRLGFLALLWLAVLITVGVLRRDLRAPRESKPTATAKAAKPAKEPKAPKGAKPPKAKRGVPTSVVVTEGAAEGLAVSLDGGPITIGRDATCTIALTDDYASSQHARLYQHDGRWVLEDLGSTNGTWIDRARITAPTVVPAGVPIRIGRTVLELRK